MRWNVLYAGDLESSTHQSPAEAAL